MLNRSNGAHLVVATLLTFANPAAAPATSDALPATATHWLNHDYPACIRDAAMLSLSDTPRAQAAGLFWTWRCAHHHNRTNLAAAARLRLIRQHPLSFHALLFLPSGHSPVDAGRHNRLLLSALVRVESSGRPDATSAAGAVGLTQLMPSTAADLLNIPPNHPALRHCLQNPRCNLLVGRAYLSRQQRAFRDLPAALFAYNAGPRRARLWTRDRPADPIAAIDTIPIRETRIHVRSVLSRLWILQMAQRILSPSRTAIAAGKWPPSP